MNVNKNSEGLKFARFMMVVSSLSPLFFLWAVRGVKCIPDTILWIGCVALIIIPNLVLWLKIRICRSQKDTKTLTVGLADDHREHLLVYLFAMLIPLYDVNLGSDREFAAALLALIFIVFLFWHLNLHYMNLVFALFGYRVFTIVPDTKEDAIDFQPFVLLTQRSYLHKGEQLQAYRISNTVFFEPKGGL